MHNHMLQGKWGQIVEYILDIFTMNKKLYLKIIFQAGPGAELPQARHRQLQAGPPARADASIASHVCIFSLSYAIAPGQRADPLSGSADSSSPAGGPASGAT